MWARVLQTRTQFRLVAGDSPQELSWISKFHVRSDVWYRLTRGMQALRLDSRPVGPRIEEKARTPACRRRTKRRPVLSSCHMKTAGFFPYSNLPLMWYSHLYTAGKPTC